jgi:hypothetical protein
MKNEKKPCRRNMMLSSRMEDGSWWTFHMEPNRLDVSGNLKTSTDQMAHLTSTKWLMEKGFAQEKGVDYEETFSPTVKWATIHALFSMVAQNRWKIHQTDVKTTFLNGYLKGNVSMSQPKGFVVKGQEHKVCKLIKSLYVLKQAPQAWYENLTEHLLKLNFKHFNLDDATLFVKKVGKIVVYLVVYVDNLCIAWNNENYIASIKKELKKGFKMTNLGHLHYYLGIEVIKNPKYIFISQKKYIRELLNKFGMASTIMFLVQ